MFKVMLLLTMVLKSSTKMNVGVGEAQKAESAMICKKAKIDLLRSASKATM